MPIIQDNQIVYTLEGDKLYFSILMQIQSMEEERIHYDDGNFIRLIMDHIQLFERHWRKLVADIRQGKLNRNLDISADARSLYESTALPRPGLAKKLDNAFRDLGFHKKVLGKDIKQQKYALRKIGNCI